MLTFENVLEIFHEYLLHDPEEEVLPCKRGYVRLTWNKDSRYCVDGILCRIPEELFDLLLTDYQDFELLRRTKGRREVTEADEKAVKELCQPYLDWRKEALLGIAVLVTYSPQNGVILLVIAFLVSPLGLPMAAVWLVGKVQDLRYAIQDAVYG